MGRNIPYEENHRITKEGDIQKKCNKHHLHFPDEDPWMLCTEEFFYKTDKNKKDGLHPECKRCCSVRSYAWSLTNPEKHKVSERRGQLSLKKKEYDKKHHAEDRASGYYAKYSRRPEVKARKYHLNHRDHEITPQEWLSCKEYFKDAEGNQVCAYCGLKIQDHWIVVNGIVKNSDFHKEHKDDKGANDIRNCIPSCRSCNCNKWAFEFKEWYNKQSFFLEESYNKIIKWCTEDYKLYIEDKPLFKIYKKKNENDNKFHHEIWELDEMMNRIRCVIVAEKKIDLELTLQELILNT